MFVASSSDLLRTYLLHASRASPLLPALVERLGQCHRDGEPQVLCPSTRLRSAGPSSVQMKSRQKVPQHGTLLCVRVLSGVRTTLLIPLNEEKLLPQAKDWPEPDPVNIYCCTLQAEATPAKGGRRWCVYVAHVCACCVVLRYAARHCAHLTCTCPRVCKPGGHVGRCLSVRACQCVRPSFSAQGGKTAASSEA